MRLRALRLPTGWLRLGVLTANKMLTLVLPLSFFGSKGKWVEVVLYRKSGVFFLMEKRGNFFFQLKQNGCGISKQCLYQQANERFW